MLPPEKWWNFTLIGVIFFVVLHSIVFFWHQFLVYRYDALYERAVEEWSLIEMPADFQKAHQTSRDRSILTRPDIIIRESTIIQSGIRSVVDQYRSNISRLRDSIAADIKTLQSITDEGDGYIFPEKESIIHETRILQKKLHSDNYKLVSELQKLSNESFIEVEKAEKSLEVVKKKIVVQDVGALIHEMAFYDSLYRFTGKKWFDYKTLSKAYKTLFTADALETKDSKELGVMFSDFSTRIEPTRIEAAKIRAQYKAKRAKLVAREKEKWGDTSTPDAPVGDVFSQVYVSTKYQRLYAFEDGELILSTPVTTGRTTHQTIRGTFKIYSKERDHLMKSPFEDEDYELWVDYWMPFSGAYGIHDSCNSKNCWRTKFGWSDYKYGGSHGCVNTPYSAVQFLYGWTRIGTTVHVD